MWITPTSGTYGALRRPFLLLLPIAFWVSACANPGPPKPPSLNLPSPAKDLRAARVGNQVRLDWTTSGETTDDTPVRPPLSAEICRDAENLPSPATCTVVQHLAVHVGPSTATDLLPASLLVDPIQILRYRVRILNASARAADPSNTAFAAAGTAPPSISALRSLASPGGTRILWQPDSSPATEIILDRTALAPIAKPATAVLSPSGQAAQKQSPPASVQLLASASGSDRGGTLDTSGQPGVTYSYVAWRVRSVVIGGRSVALRSQVSPPLILTLRDLTPPATPAGLEAVVDGGSVDLSWEPDTEADLAGYWVERAEGANAEAPAGSEVWQRINSAPISAPAFHDGPSLSGRTLRYRVLAVDTTGNLSQPTPPVSVRLHADPAP